MKSKLLRMILPVFFLFPCLSFAQSESAALFLLIQPSTQATAMGGVSVASVSDDPVAMAFNPAHLGMLPGKPLFSVEVYPGTTDWLPSLASNISYDANHSRLAFPSSRMGNRHDTAWVLATPESIWISASKSLPAKTVLSR